MPPLQVLNGERGELRAQEADRDPIKAEELCLCLSLQFWSRLQHYLKIVGGGG